MPIDITRAHFRGLRNIEGEEDEELAALLQNLQTQIASESGGSIVVSLEADVNVNLGQPLYSKANAAWGKAQGDTEATATVVGLCLVSAEAGFTAVVQTAGTMELPQATWEPITGEPAGLTPGAEYWLRTDTAASLSKIVPTTGFQTLVGVAQDNNVMTIKIWRPIKL